MVSERRRRIPFPYITVFAGRNCTRNGTAQYAHFLATRQTSQVLRTMADGRGAGEVDFFRRSPLAKAIADGELSADAFERERELPRDIDLSDLDPGKLNDAAP
jgi:hypothetical protein